jgi:hypothetical protein
MTGLPSDNSNEPEGKRGIFKRLQEGWFPYGLLAIALLLAAYIIGYGMMQGG